MSRRPRKSDYNLYSSKLPCEGKKVFDSEAKAIAAAEFGMLDTLGLELSVYQCHVCHKWHLTSVKPAK